MRRLNTLTLAGEASALLVTPNGQHAFAAVRRRRWELASMSRLAEVCAARAAGTGDAFVAALAEHVTPEQCFRPHATSTATTM